MKYKIEVKLKPEVLDPEGRAILNSMKNLGHEAIQHVESFKSYIVKVDPSSPNPRQEVEAIASSLLANPVSHQYRIFEES